MASKTMKVKSKTGTKVYRLPVDKGQALIDSGTFEKAPQNAKACNDEKKLEKKEADDMIGRPLKGGRAVKIEYLVDKFKKHKTKVKNKLNGQFSNIRVFLRRDKHIESQ